MPPPGHSFAPHPVRWDKVSAARYWNFLAEHPSSAQNYFSDQVGNSVIAYLRRHKLPLAGRVLDFGCGPGFLLAKLASRGIRCEGVDFSARSVDLARRRVADLSSCSGVTLARSLPTPLPDESFDLVVSLESIEHILPEDRQPTFAEIRRLLRPGGILVLTTPNEESLEQSSQMCPECGCVFHRMQHVASWSAPSLSTTMEDLGWETLRAEAVLFRLDTSRLVRLREWIDRRRGRRGPHLVWTGRPRIPM